MARKCMQVNTGGSRVVELKDQKPNADGAKKKRASKKSAKSKPVEGK